MHSEIEVRETAARPWKALTTPRALAVIALLLFLLPTPAHAWGKTGHRVSGRIAERHVKPETAARVLELIGPESLAQVGNWMDQIRSDPSWRRAAPWHWVTIPDGETYESSEKNAQGDILWAIEDFSAVLADTSKPKQDRVEALKILVHLISDLHQPLHVGRGDDRGGNEVLVTWHDEPSNLHRMWDEDIIDFEKLSFTEWVEFIDHATPEEVAEWQGSTPLDWAMESHALRDQAYELGDRRLGYGYSFKNLPLVEKRLLQSGIRLAGHLDRLLSPAEAAP